MTAPRLEITGEPGLNGQLYYLPLAPQSRDHDERYMVAVRLWITNRDTSRPSVTITGISFVFPDHGAFPMERVPSRSMLPEDGILVPDAVARWHNGSWRIDKDHAWEHNQVYLDGPAPTRMTIQVTCAGFDEAYEQEFDLIRWGNPTGDGALILPFAREDLDDDEYVVTSAAHGYPGGAGGTQIFAYDISIQARLGGEWSRNRIANPKVNTDSRVFGRAVRAMGHGTVFHVDTGYRPGRFHTTEEGYWDNEFGGPNRADDDHYGSITVWVRYGDIEIGYMHLRRGSVAVEVGDTVWPGRKLAEAGNSGNTNGSPHLHMECRVTSTDRICAMTFRNTWQLQRSLVPEDNSAGKRVRMVDQGISQQTAALRPFATQHIPPSTGGLEDPEIAEIVAEVFGGVSKGGDGIVIINGKLTRVPPRGIKAALLQAIVEIANAEELAPEVAAKRIDAAAKAAVKALQGKLGG